MSLSGCISDKMWNYASSLAQLEEVCGWDTRTRTCTQHMHDIQVQQFLKAII